MGFLEKEREMLDAMKRTNFSKFTKGKEAAINTMTRHLSAFPAYMTAVVNHTVLPNIYRATMDGPEFREKMTTLDNTRRHCHENAILAVNALNRVCERHGLEPFSTVDTTDRYAVADMVNDYMTEVYKAGLANRGPKEEKVKEHLDEIRKEMDMELE